MPMSARADSPEGERLEVLVTLVEAYEKKHYRYRSPIAGSTPEEFGAFLKSEIDKWARVIKTANVRGE